MLSIALSIERAMKFFGSYSFLTILNESIKLLPKNGKLMVFIALFSVLLSSCFYFLFRYSFKSLFLDILVTSQQAFMPDPSSFNMPDPNSFDSADPSTFTPKTGFNPAQIIAQLDHLKEDFAILFVVQIASVLAFSIISSFSNISTILVSVMSYSAKNLSLKELFSMIWRTWTRPLITSFYVSALVIGYYVVVVILAAPLLVYPNLAALRVAKFVGILALIFQLYLAVPWTLSIVVSVVEESCYGMEALGKAAALVRGKRLHGFLFNIFINLVLLIIYLAYKMILLKYIFTTISLLLLTSSYALVNIFVMVAYTVFYFQCKVHHGEETELHGSLQYTKLPTTVLANDTL